MLTIAKGPALLCKKEFLIGIWLSYWNAKGQREMIPPLAEFSAKANLQSSTEVWIQSVELNLYLYQTVGFFVFS